MTGPARHVGGFPKQFLPAPLCCVPRSACKEARTLVGLAAPMTFTLLCRFAQVRATGPQRSVRLGQRCAVHRHRLCHVVSAGFH